MPSAVQITILGHAGKDAELKYTSSGTAMCKFSVAVTHGRDDRAETTWYDVTLFGNYAEETAQRIHKGDLVFVAGDRLKVEPWLGNDGGPRASLYLTARTVRVVGRVEKREREDVSSDRADGGDSNLPF